MSEININEKSAGAVIFRKEQNEALFLLLHYPSGHWDFVKGKIEPEENLRQTGYQKNTMLNICDVDLVGKKISEKNLQVDISKNYYGEKLVETEEAE